MLLSSTSPHGHFASLRSRSSTSATMASHLALSGPDTPDLQHWVFSIHGCKCFLKDFRGRFAGPESRQIDLCDFRYFRRRCSPKISHPTFMVSMCFFRCFGPRPPGAHPKTGAVIFCISHELGGCRRNLVWFLARISQASISNNLDGRPALNLVGAPNFLPSVC